MADVRDILASMIMSTLLTTPWQLLKIFKEKKLRLKIQRKSISTKKE